ncbi:MAG: hypothetical protein JSR28_03970 [Proteobacteria bacterium]|nr:hypothetical protein [Pseudomonadota bacterium]MDE2412199.1 hypothetical protein [Sphingomonadales bacterium]
MRRALVLTDEAARHPFLASLPAHVRVADAAAAKPRWPGLAPGMMRDVAATYCAAFVAVSLFIA